MGLGALIDGVRSRPSPEESLGGSKAEDNLG